MKETISPLLCQIGGRGFQPIGPYIKRTAKQLSVFLLISSRYCCWTRPGKCKDSAFSRKHNPGAEFSGVAVSFSMAGKAVGGGSLNLSDCLNQNLDKGFHICNKLTTDDKG